MNQGANNIRALLAQTLPPTRANERKLRGACQEFESLFLSYLLKLMRDTIPKSGLLEGGIGEDLFTYIIDQNLAINLAKGEGLGLSSLLWQGLDQREPSPGVGKKSLPLWSQGTFLKAYKEPALPKVSKGVIKKLKKYDHLISDTASSYNLNPNLVRAVIVQESRGEPQAQSPKGAKGLMQLLDGTSRDLGVVNPFSPEENIKGGCKYLKQLISRFGGDLPLALAAYNAGPEVVERYGSLPPIKETREYVKGVLNYKNLFDLIYPSL